MSSLWVSGFRPLPTISELLLLMALDFVTTDVDYAFVVDPDFYHGPELLILILSFFRLGRGGVREKLWCFWCAFE